MAAYLFWDRDKHIELNSLQELEQALDRLAAQAQRNNLPIGVEVNVSPETCLLVVVGHAKSHLAFHATTGPYAVISRGPWDSNERLETTYMGEFSSVQERYCVPIADAREAVRRYFLTGTRPNNIVWEA